MARRLSSIGELARVSRKRGALIFLLAKLVTACVHDPLPLPPKNYVNRDVGGVIGGKIWKYQHAYVDPTIKTPEEEDLVVVLLPFKPKKICDRQEYDKPHVSSVMVTVPNSTEAVLLTRGSSRMLQFHFDHKGKQWVTAAKTGKAKLTKISPNKVHGKLLAKYTNELWVAGNFEAVLCEYADLRTYDDDEQD